jgi:hypothetical protein
MIIGFIIACVPGALWAGQAPDREQVYMGVDEFVSKSFVDLGDTPQPTTFWPKGEVRSQLKEILGHSPSLRFRYWGAHGKTVWVMDEIGKDRPITAGVVIDDDAIANIEVLVFRESRGWEIKHDFFTRQFQNVRLGQRHRLSQSIDNITGATLSVKAMTRMARAALLMHRHTDQATSILATAR